MVKNNDIDASSIEMGIRVRNGYDVTITKNTNYNAILIEHGNAWLSNSGTITITGNTIENWGLSGKEGRAFRGEFGSGAMTLDKGIIFTGNKMIHTGTVPEEYVKVTNVGTIEVVLEKNYWNSTDPDLDTIVVVTGGNNTVDIEEYYLMGTMEIDDLNTYVEEKQEEEEVNPATADSVMLYVGLGIGLLIDLSFLSYIFKKNC